MDRRVTNNWLRLRDPSSVRLLTLLGAEHGIEPQRILAGTELSPMDLNDPGTIVRGETEVEVVRNLLRALPQVEDLGLQAGQRYYTTLHGPLGQAYASCANGWEAFELVERFSPLTWGMVSSSTEVFGDWGHIAVSAGSLPTDVRSFYVQRDNTMLPSIAAEIGMRLTLAGGVPNQWTQPAPKDPATLQRWTDLWGSAPEFGAAANVIKVQVAAIMQPLPRANPLAMPGLIAACEKLKQEVEARDLVSGKVRTYLLSELSAGVGLQEVSAHLHTSERTLRRQLGEEGTSFREILDQVRYEVAADLLAGSQLTVSQISTRTGYESAPAFTSAFRRWAGQAPSEYRESLATRTS